MIIGILSIQGAFIEHKTILDSMNINTKLVKTKDDFDIDGLIIPGGESSVMKKFILEWNLYDILYEYIFILKKPIFGTCAGCILLSKIVINRGIKESGLFPILDIVVERNSYGTQQNSFIETTDIRDIGQFDCIFIRAPKILNSFNCHIYAKVNNHPIMLIDNNILACTFHPELINNSIHDFFIKNLVIKNQHYSFK